MKTYVSTITEGKQDHANGPIWLLSSLA